MILELLYLAVLFIFILYLIIQVFKCKVTTLDKAKIEIEKRVQDEFQVRSHQLLMKRGELESIKDPDSKYDGMISWREEIEQYYKDYNAQIEYELEQLNVVRIKF
ncbi:hypothetical protein [Pseudoalteromonas umbrosa]|uniref:hypothetical protein n=1 Tax=Pseudoalteromonas umbrosa TaxID=3048489 RepID=UPI0024C28911|nr:hypothetical protein [Pseudoalteromonas sp. B95]MDK1288512.1 hypothetical protein [Pseudoalteromonas sp. B95]